MLFHVNPRHTVPLANGLPDPPGFLSTLSVRSQLAELGMPKTLKVMDPGANKLIEVRAVQPVKI